LQSCARLSSANSLQLIQVFPDLAFGLLFHRLKTIFDRMKTVYCRDRNQQMQSKYSCSQSQGDAKSCLLTYKINKQCETRFLTQLRKFVIRPQAMVSFYRWATQLEGLQFFSSFLTFLQTAKVGVFLVQRDTNNTANYGVVHSSLRLR